MEDTEITYRIKLNDQVTEVFEFVLDDTTFDLPLPEIEDPPHWAELEHNKCSHCPLDAEEHPHCPMALHLHTILERFHDTKSIDMVELEVETDERRVIQKVQLQKALADMLTMVFPTSGCPKTKYMKPLARFHAPLASEEETVFRVTGMYMLAQYFVNTTNREAEIDFEGLSRIYEEMHELNAAVARRLMSATNSDSTKNAITLVDMYSTLVPMLLEDELVEMRGFFEAYLPDGDDTATRSSGHGYLEKAKAFSLELIPLEGDEMPDWMKDVKGDASPGKASFALPEDEEEEEKKAPSPKKEEPEFDAPDLSLEPIGNGGTTTDASGKVSYALPDDEAAPEAEKQQAPAEKEKQKQDAPPLSSLSLDNLELAPLDGEKPASKGGKASYDLPDE